MGMELDVEKMTDAHTTGLLARQRARTRMACDALECVLEILDAERAKHPEESAEWRRYNQAMQIANKAIASSRENPQ